MPETPPPKVEFAGRRGEDLLVRERERVADERWAAHYREHAIHERGHEREHQDYRDRIDHATDALQARLDQMNAWREQLSEERATFVPRESLQEMLAAMEKQNERIGVRVRDLEVARGNLEGRLWAIGAVISVVVVAFQIAIAILG